MTQSSRSRLLSKGVIARVCARLAAAGALSAILSAGNSGLPQTSPGQPNEEFLTLESGKPVELKFAGSGKHAYRFELSQGQYTSILVNCPNLGATVYLLDASGTAIDRSYGNPKSTKENVEVAADKSGRYGIEIESKSRQASGKVCTIELEPSRSAAEKDLLLQQARTRVFQAAGMISAGKPDEAADQLQQALALREKILGPQDPSVVRPLSLLGDIYLNKPDFQKAEALYTRALKVQDQADPEAGPVFSLLNNLGTIYTRTDRFNEAEQALLRAIDVAEKVYGAGQPAVVNSIVNLGVLYEDKGDYPKAQALYEQALAAGEKALGPDYPGLAVIISNLADVYAERGDNINAVRFGQRAIALLEKSGRPEPHRLAIALLALGDAYRSQGDLDQAEPPYQRSLEVCEKALGPDDPLLADSLGSLADIYRDRRDFAKAEAFYQRSLEIRKKKFGEGNSSVAESLNNLGSLHRDQGDYARAEPLYRQALAIREKALGPEHPDVAETLTNLSELEMAAGHSAEAESLLSRAIAISEYNAGLNLLAGSERQKLAYLKLSSSQLDRAITLSASLAPPQEAALNLAVTTVLQRKGRVQDVLAGNLKTLRQRLDAGGVKLLDEFDDVTSQLARLVLGGPQQTTIEEHEKRINALKERREQLEAEISLRSAQFRAASQPVTLEAVRAALPANSALIEFVNYQRLLPAPLKDKRGLLESRYIAYVVRSSGQVQWRELGDAEKLDRAMDAYRQALRDPDRNDVKQLARNLDEKILQPLRPLFGDAEHLLISPDGQLSLMPFEALADRQGHYAIESYSITYLSTGRDLLRMQVTAPSKSNSIVVADPFFGEPNTSQIAGLHLPDVKSRRRSITTASDLSGVYFAPLTGTAQEARSIHALFPEATVVTGTHASVAALKQVEAPRILHIATHGFFLLDQRSNSGPVANGPAAAPARGVEANLDLENPLLRSGLAFAGANLNRAGKDSGILTALEASDLDLWGTKLVTLSACDTGIGEVRDREGVYGLRRAFVLAGAETLVMSLWPVSDYVTREMMTAYYTGLKKGLGRGEALRQAELAMMARKGRQHPFYWASFIQSGEWANLDGQR